MPFRLALSGLLILAQLFLSSPAKGEENDAALLQGVWELQVMNLGGKEYKRDPNKESNQTFKFEKDRFGHELSGRDEKIEEGTFRLDPTQKPKQLDLIYSKGSVQEPRQCIYEIKDDELKIAFTMSFAPGTPEQELARAKRAFAIRPNSFEPGQKADNEFSRILILKRQK